MEADSFPLWSRDDEGFRQRARIDPRERPNHDRPGLIHQGTPSGPPHEGSRETYEGKIVSVPKECTPLSASPTVRAQDKPMVRYLDKWWMNHKNTWGCLNNSEDMGKYDPPKLQNIDQKMVAQADTLTMTDGLPEVKIISPGQAAKAVGAVVATPEAGAVGVAGVTAVGTGFAVGAGLNAQQRLTQGMNAGTPGNTTPTYTGGIDFSAPPPQAPLPLSNPATPLPPIPATQAAQQQPTSTATPQAEQAPSSSPPLTAPDQEKPLPPSTQAEGTGPTISESKRADGFGAWVRVTMRNNPCFHLSKGNPNGSGPYRGGSYDGTKGGGDEYESNHTPAWAGGASDTGLSEGASPSGMMDKEDHRDLLSTGSSQASQDYRAGTRDLGLQGDYRGAVAQEYLQMWAAAQASGNGRKYNEMMREMSDYRRCMEEHGLLPKK